MMHTLVRRASISAALRGARFLGVLPAALLWMPGPAAWGQDPAEITSAVEVRNLSAGEAEAGRPVRLRGVVTFFDEVIYGRFIQDDTAGIYLRESTNTPTLFPGQVVEVLGVTSPGEYAPIVVPQEVRMVGEAPLPEAKPATFEQLASGQEDSQFVEISGIVRSARLDEVFGYHLVELATGGGRLVVFIKDIPVAAPEDLVDSTVRVRGVCSTIFNRQRQLFNIRLVVPRASDLVVETPALKNPFQMPARTIGSLLQFTPQGSYGRRVKVVGHRHPAAAWNRLVHSGRCRWSLREDRANRRRSRLATWSRSWVSRLRASILPASRMRSTARSAPGPNPNRTLWIMTKCSRARTIVAWFASRPGCWIG